MILTDQQFWPGSTILASLVHASVISGVLTRASWSMMALSMTARMIGASLSEVSSSSQLALAFHIASKGSKNTRAKVS